MIHAVAPLAPAFLVMATRIRAEEDTARFQTCFQFQQNARQLPAGYMTPSGIGEDAIDTAIRYIEPEEVLVPHVRAAVGTGDDGEWHGGFQTHRDVTEFGERLEVASRPAAKSEDFERRVIPNACQ